MNKIKKIIVPIIIIIIAIVVITGYSNARKKAEAERIEEEQRIATEYAMVNTLLNEGYIEHYIPLIPNENSFDGVQGWVYLDLAYYRQQTGKMLTYEMVVEYFSQEYEEDGSLRHFSNGKHTEIGSYVMWRYYRPEEASRYRNNISDIYEQYYEDHLNEGFENLHMETWSRATLDELIKKEANPEYEIDLLSIQIRERAEAETQEVA